MLLASLSNVVKEHAGKAVLDGVSFEIKSGARLGLVGENGAGKSTIFRILVGEEKADKGTVSRRKGLVFGYLRQQPALRLGTTVYQNAIEASPKISAINIRLSEIERSLAEPAVVNDSKRLQRLLDEQADLLDKFQVNKGYAHENRVRYILEQLHFEELHYNQPVETLSGGEKKLLNLACLLIQEPELLLLDEPDNHLDLVGKRWLASYINEHNGAVVLITHDRYLLDEVANRIIDIEDGKAYEYFCNYSKYVEERKRRLLRLQQEFLQQQEHISTLEKQARQLKYWASRNPKFAGRAEGRIKMIERAKESAIEQPTLTRPKIKLRFEVERSGQRVIDLSRIGHSYSERVVLDNFSLLVRYGERLGIIGANGSGKSTLLKIINGTVQPDSGEVVLGSNVQIGYYSQEQETLPSDEKPLDWIRTLSPMTEQQGINVLHKLLFTYDQMHSQIKFLSGGEKSRLQLASIMLAGANLLLLDEPTNNLDIPSAEILESSLADFEGTIITVSHDRYFLDKIVTKLLVFSDAGSVSMYDGNFSSYVAQKSLQEQTHGSDLK
jgi:ATP-binding cassette, subfamily F, member 3